MVASSGAGPRPIDHKSLDPASLASAIRFCLTPGALLAAQKIAENMSHENGVKEAVKSFHRNLPIKQMRCDLLPRKAAVWKYEIDNNKAMKLSDEAAFILMEEKKVKMNKLRVYQCKTIEIENTRWDPLSAGGSTLFDTVMDLRSGGKTMVASVQKAQMLQRENSDGASSGAGAASIAVGKGIGKISAGLAKGVMLDLPVAMADGFHALPVLYGDKKMERGAVKDWKSGMKVGGRVSYF
jgi:sterol 3beta-glucosyltransferase